MSKNYSLLKKTMVFTMVALFIGVVVAPCIVSINIESKKNPTAKTFTFNPFKEGWKYRKKITIDSDKVTGNLVNYPLLISTIDSDLRDKAHPYGDDIIFMDGKGEASQLFHEIESFESNSGELAAWVNVPVLSSAADLKIFMYYGNPDSGTQEIPESVWDSYYCGVWHMNDLLDSTINSNDGTNYGTDEGTGKIGKARDFVEINHDYISLGDMPEPSDDSISTATFEAWINPVDLGDYVKPNTIICKKDTNIEPDKQSYSFKIESSGKIKFSAQSGTWYPDRRTIRFTTINSVVFNGNWQYIVAVVDLSTSKGSAVLYYNGEPQTIQIEIDGTPPSHFYDISLDEKLGRAANENGIFYYDGSMDEIRISKICRSEEWVETQFNNQNDVSSFLKFGREIKPRQRSYWKLPFQQFLQSHPNLLLVLRYLINLE